MSNYKSLNKISVLAINASGLLCPRRGALKMLIELDLSFAEAQKWLLMRISSVGVFIFSRC